MNIKTFLEWRPKCFLCGEEMFVGMDFPRYKVSECEKPQYFIKDEALHFQSKYIKLSVDIISGYVQSEDNSVLLTNFLASNNLELRARCMQCIQNGKVYIHTGIYDASATMTHMKMVEMQETVLIDDLYFNQWQSKQTAVINKLVVREGEDIRVRSNDLYIPYLDLSKINPDKFTNKIRTYVTFS